MSNVNDTLLQFLNNGPIDKVVSNLQKKQGTRYNGYLELLKIVEVKDIEDLTSLADETGQAMLLAEKLIGQKAFWASIVKSIWRNAIHDTIHGYSTGYSVEYLIGAEYVNLENTIRHEMMLLER